MKNIIEVLLLLGFLLVGYCASSQELTQTIRGTVVDKENQIPLIGMSNWNASQFITDNLLVCLNHLLISHFRGAGGQNLKI